MRTKRKVEQLERRIATLEEELTQQNLVGAHNHCWGLFTPGDCFEDRYNTYRLPVVVDCLRHILKHLKLDFTHKKIDKWELAELKEEKRAK